MLNGKRRVLAAVHGRDLQKKKSTEGRPNSVVEWEVPSVLLWSVLLQEDNRTASFPKRQQYSQSWMDSNRLMSSLPAASRTSVPGGACCCACCCSSGVCM